MKFNWAYKLMSARKIGGKWKSTFTSIDFKMGTLFLKLIQAENQLLKGFTNLKLKHDILEVKILIFSLPENITFTFWNISYISILV